MMSRPKSVDDVRRIVGQMPPSVLICPKCPTTQVADAQHVSQNTLYDWAVTITCSKCWYQWNACSLCTATVRKPLESQGSMYSHNYKKHNNSKK
jgi:hypothetical protein